MTKTLRGASSKPQSQRQREAAVWLRIAKHIEQTGKVPGNCGICRAASEELGLFRSYDVVKACFGSGWPFGDYGSPAGNKQRVLAATLLSLIVCTNQEPEPRND